MKTAIAAENLTKSKYTENCLFIERLSLPTKHTRKRSSFKRTKRHFFHGFIEALLRCVTTYH